MFSASSKFSFIINSRRPKMALEFPFELDRFQKQAVMRLERRLVSTDLIFQSIILRPTMYNQLYLCIKENVFLLLHIHQRAKQS